MTNKFCRVGVRIGWGKPIGGPALGWLGVCLVCIGKHVGSYSVSKGLANKSVRFIRQLVLWSILRSYVFSIQRCRTKPNMIIGKT